MTPKGIPRGWLEELMKKLVYEEKWEVLADVLALAIYDLVLFPSNGNWVSPAATDVFMARKCRGENSTYPVLADTYYTLSYCHESKGRKIVCCLPVLYVWLTAHVLKRKNSSFCPVSELTNMESRTYNDKEWKQMFMELNEDSVRWYPLATGVGQVLFSCGEFPNVPLMGTLGCINYNPVLALRQLRYPLMGPPAEELLIPFKVDLKNGSMLERVHKAWKNVTYKAEELGKRGVGAAATYKEWVRSRVKMIKLPFQTLALNPPQETDTVMRDSDEVKLMKDKLAKAEKEKEAKESELKEARSILKALEMECKEKAQSLEQANKRARIEKDSGNKAKNYLSSTNQDLRKQIAECHGALRENEQLRRMLQERERQVNTLMAQVDDQASRHEADKQAYLEAIRGYQGRLEEKHIEVDELLKVREGVLEENWRLKGEVVNLEASRAEAVSQYERKIRDIQVEVDGIIHRYRTIIERKDEELRNLDHWAGERNHYMGLVRAAELNRIESWYEVGHWAHKLKNVRRIPKLVRDAETMVNPLTTPREAIELIDVCKGLTEEFEKLVEQAMKDVAVNIIDV